LRRWLYLTFFLALSCGSTALAETFVHGISLLHELKYPADFQHFDYVNPDAPRGGTFVGYGTADVRNFGGDWSNEIEPAVGWERTYDRLIIRSADELAGYYGSLADGISVAADQRAITFRLHAGARFHDQVPITSRDVKFSFDQAMGTVDGQLFLDWIESVEILDERQIRVNLKEPLTNSNLLLLSYAPRILPFHYWENRGDPSETTLEPPLGSGPYRFADYDKGYVRYERVKDYWGADLPVNRGRFNFDEIRYEIYRDATVTREALRKGLLDYYFEPDIRQWSSTYDTPAARAGWLVREELYVRDNAGPASAITFNTRRPRFADLRVREALVLAYDFEWQNRTLWHGTETRANSYFARSDFAATGLPDASELALLEPFRKQLPERVFTQPYKLPVSDGIGRNRTALARASELLAAASWRLQNGELIDRDGTPFEIEFLMPGPDQQRMILPYIGSLARLGIRGSMRLVESAQWINLMQSFEYDAFVQGHGTSQPPVMMLPFFFHSSAADKPLTFNKAGIVDPVIDTLIEQAQSATRLSDIVTACRSLDRVLLWNFYHVPLATVAPPRLVYWDKFGRPERETGARHMQSVDFIDMWWYDPARAARIKVVD
jgi:microcin C transport system substrate-binding protein